MAVGGMEQGYNLIVGNGGKDTFPPFDVEICHPRIGRLRTFKSPIRGDLLVDQRREFKWKLFSGDSICFPVHMLTTTGGGVVLTDEEIDQYTIKLILEHSDKVLFENRQIGAHVVRTICQAAQLGHCFQPLKKGDRESG
jgi:hypothetical protein